MVLVRQANDYDMDDEHLSSTHILGLPFLSNVQSGEPGGKCEGGGRFGSKWGQQEDKVRKGAEKREKR